MRIQKIGISILSTVLTLASAKAAFQEPTLSGDVQCIIVEQGLDGVGNIVDTGNQYNMSVQVANGKGQLTVIQDGQVVTTFKVTGNRSTISPLFGESFFVPNIQFLADPSVDIKDQWVSIHLSSDVQNDTFVMMSPSNSSASISLTDSGQIVRVSGRMDCQGQLSINK